jgi:hypothetical protein
MARSRVRRKASARRIVAVLSQRRKTPVRHRRCQGTSHPAAKAATLPTGER